MFYDIDRDSFLYLIRGDQDGKIFSKIGVSSYPEDRLNQHRKSQPHVKFSMIFKTPIENHYLALDIEREICRAMRPFVFRGREWFSVPPENVMPLINQTIKKHTPSAFDLCGWIKQRGANHGARLV